MCSVSQVVSQSENGSEGQSAASGEFKLEFVKVTPTPLVARFDRPHDRMPGRMEMLRRVFVLGRIAATHMAADHAHPQVNPGVVHFQTLFTAVCTRRHIFDLVDMVAGHNSASHGLFQHNV
jgi:hypothetical protein